jgi:uncharacterized protein (UPF0548 family)
MRIAANLKIILNISCIVFILATESCKTRPAKVSPSQVNSDYYKIDDRCKNWMAKPLTANLTDVGKGQHDIYDIVIVKTSDSKKLRATFENVKNRLIRYQQYPVSIISPSICDSSLRIKKGTTIIQDINILGKTWETANRVLEISEQKTEFLDEWAFRVGSVLGHKEKGVVRYSVRLDKKLNQVSYHIETYSTPGSWLVKLGKPVVRHYQVSYSNQSLEHVKKQENPNLSE